MAVENVRKRKIITLNNLLIAFFVIWPFFWNIWGVFYFTASIGVSIPLYTLWLLTALIILFNRKIKKSFLYTWLFFLGIIIAESMFRPGTGIIDLSVIFCGAVVCICMVQRKLDYKMILECLYIIGLTVAISVVLDSAFGLFREGLINLYTAQYQEVKTRLTATGGILPHTGSAGCYIYLGLAAYIAKIRLENKKWNRLRRWIILFIFGIAILVIQKRGFILDMIAAVAVLAVLQIKKEKLGKLSENKLAKVIVGIVLIVVIFTVLYSKIPLIKDAFDSLVNKFTEEDSTLSGRTDLYELALSMYKGHSLIGIGWGMFRRNSVGIFGVSDRSYNAHSVYIQLLCETGIIGLGAFLFASLSSLIYGMKKYRKIIKSGLYVKEKSILEAGIAVQIFFLGYCVSGNPLYDYNFCIAYFIGILLTLVSIGKGENGLCVSAF